MVFGAKMFGGRKSKRAPAESEFRPGGPQQNTRPSSESPFHAQLASYRTNNIFNKTKADQNYDLKIFRHAHTHTILLCTGQQVAFHGILHPKNIVIYTVLLERLQVSFLLFYHHFFISSEPVFLCLCYEIYFFFEEINCLVKRLN